MANAYYERGSSFNPDELADGDAIEAEFDAVVRGFDTIETQIDTNKAGYPTQTFHVAPATEPTHAIQQAQLDSGLAPKLNAANYNAADVLSKLKTVDGTNSGLDADLLDGQEGSYYRNAANINNGTLAKERLPASIDASTSGNAATASKVSNTAPNGGTADLVSSAMAGSDFFRIRVGGGADAGWTEIATAGNGNEPIYVRQYSGLTIVRTLALLDGNGNTALPNNLYLYGNLPWVEYGANYNGEYYRYADGTQICTRTVSANLQNPTTHAYAANFVAAPVVVVSNDAATLQSATSVNVTPGSFAFFSSTTIDTVKMIAIGRWK